MFNSPKKYMLNSENFGLGIEGTSGHSNLVTSPWLELAVNVDFLWSPSLKGISNLNGDTSNCSHVEHIVT